MQPGEQHPTTPEEAKKKLDMMHKQSYANLMIMTVISFISMYILMYAMTNTLANVFNNFNQVYMAGLMTAPMVITSLVVMKMMYPNKSRNAVLIAVSVIVGLLLYLSIRQQTLIYDTQFLKSMIPHHSSAITMCQQASISDPEIQQLCQEIISSQQSEIDQMKAILERME